MKSRLDIGELAITCCQSLIRKRNYSEAIEIARRVISHLEALESEEIKMPEDAVRAIRQCEQILSDCEEISERGEEFAAGVVETVESIQGWIEENRDVTEKQLAALANMEEGVARWIHR